MRERNIPANRLPAVCECGAHGWALLGRGEVAFFSPEKLALVEGRVWSLLATSHRKTARKYAVGGGEGGKTAYMHRVLVGAEGDAQVDHRDGDGLSNWDENLRVCTALDNGRSKRARKGGSSPFKGVYHQRGRFVAQICAGGLRKRLGTFSCPIEAARTYDKAALEAFGEFALTNAMLGLIPPAA